MIFVTVGTSSFDPLIEAIDSLIEKKYIQERIIAQVGRGKYIPKNMEYFRFVENIEELIDKARIVITTGGAGTIFECLAKEKNIISVENTEVSASHQKELLYILHKRGHLIWCRNFDEISKYIKWFETNKLTLFQPEKLDFNLVLLRAFAKDKKKHWWKFW